jgi:plasmid stabilization system protein ParE
VARSVKWTQRAWSDLEQAAEYIAQDSPHYAATLVARARDLARTLDRFPQRGRIVPELHDPDIRELFVASFRLVYRVRPSSVEILALIHGARDLAALWQREPPMAP